MAKSNTETALSVLNSPTDDQSVLARPRSRASALVRDLLDEQERYGINDQGYPQQRWLSEGRLLYIEERDWAYFKSEGYQEASEAHIRAAVRAHGIEILPGGAEDMHELQIFHNELLKEVERLRQENDVLRALAESQQEDGAKAELEAARLWREEMQDELEALKRQRQALTDALRTAQTQLDLYKDMVRKQGLDDHAPQLEPFDK
jgi:hypothetical protein